MMRVGVTGDFRPLGPIIDSRRGCWFGEDLRFSGGIDFLHTNPVCEVQIWLEAVQQPHSAPDTTTFVSPCETQWCMSAPRCSCGTCLICVGCEEALFTFGSMQTDLWAYYNCMNQRCCGEAVYSECWGISLPRTTCDSHSSL